MCGRIVTQAVLMNHTNGDVVTYELSSHFDWDADSGASGNITLQKSGVSTVLERDGPAGADLQIVTNVLGDTSFRLRVQGTLTDDIEVAAVTRVIALSPSAELVEQQQADLAGEMLITATGSMNLTT